MKHHPISRARHADQEDPSGGAGAKLAHDTQTMSAARPTRYLALIAAMAAAGLFGVTSLASTGRPSSIAAASPEPAVTSVNCEGSAASFEARGTSGCSSLHYLTAPTSNIPPSPCRGLLFAASRLLSGEPTSWIISLIDSGGLIGQTIDQAIHDRLVQVQRILRGTNSANAQRTIDLESLNELIAHAATQPCSSAACASDEHTAVEDAGAAASAGWYWLCESPSSDRTN